MALLAVFAVLAGNLQRARSRSPQKSWTFARARVEITANRRLFFRRSRCFLKRRGSQTRFSFANEFQKAILIISLNQSFVNITNKACISRPARRCLAPTTSRYARPRLAARAGRAPACPLLGSTKVAKIVLGSGFERPPVDRHEPHRDDCAVLLHANDRIVALIG